MADSQEQNLPSVSVIVPVYNDQSNIGSLIESLLNQDYRHDLLEIIIVDNNSTDRTREIISGYPVTLLEESDVQSSYAARNKGIAHACGSVLAFTDSDCRPAITWIREGIDALISQSADLAGGNVEFVLSDKRTAAEMYDSITHIQVEAGIREGKGCPTANLFARARLFEEMGLFGATLTSGGDYIWTNKAIRNGHLPVFAHRAIVKHPTRSLKSLLKKRWRTGGGALEYWRKAGLAWWKILLLILRMFLPRRFSMLKKAANERGTPDMHRKILRIWGISYICTLTTLLAITVSLIRPSAGREARQKRSLKK